MLKIKVKHNNNTEECYSPPPLRKSRPEIREARGCYTSRGKTLFHWLRFITTLSLEHKAILLAKNWILDMEVFSSGCSQHAFSTNWLLENLDCSRIKDWFWMFLCASLNRVLGILAHSEIAEHLFYRIGINLLFGTHVALLLSDCSIAPYKIWWLFFG